jgi:hypothetical protein
MLLHSFEVYSLKYGEVVSVDNDENCITTMQERYKDIPDLKWIVCDLITGDGMHENIEYLHDENFDLIIDKGTFDAVLVEGTVSPMLNHVYRLLKLEGAYVMCSFNTQDLLSQLLHPHTIGWKASFYECNDKTRVVACKKTSSIHVDWELVAYEEAMYLNRHFTIDEPLLTPDVEALIRTQFVTTLALKDAHVVLFQSKIFENEEVLEYDYDLFMEDLQTFKLNTAGYMNAEEAVAFLRRMQ